MELIQDIRISKFKKGRHLTLASIFLTTNNITSKATIKRPY